MSIEVKHLTYTYSKRTPYEKRALDDVSLTVETGEFFGIIGNTGGGKSTFVQHLNGLIKLQEGQVTVNGLDVTQKKRLKQLRFDVGMVFQYPEYQLFDETVAKDVAYGPKNMKLPADEIESRVREALELVGLNYDEIAQRSPFELSGGQKRRVAIAGVLAMKPSVLVLDEPTAGLDPIGRRDVLNLLRKLHQTTIPTIVMISHNMDEIAAIADRIAVFCDSRIRFVGTPAEVFSHETELKEIGLDLPMAATLRNRLIERGFDISGDIVTVDALAEALKTQIHSEKSVVGGSETDDENGKAINKGEEEKPNV